MEKMKETAIAGCSKSGDGMQVGNDLTEGLATMRRSKGGKGECEILS